MSTPNPLIPQGTFQAQAAKGASNVRLAVATIVAIHIVFFGGLLLQGCKREPQTTVATQETNSTAATTNLNYPPLDSSLYYPTGGVPSEVGTATAHSASNPSPFTPSYGGLASQPTNAETLWQSSNLTTSGTQDGMLNTGSEAVGPTKEYTIVNRDTLGAIAKRNNVTLSALRKANPGIDPAKIRPGQKILIPASESAASGTTLNSGTTTPTSASNGSGKTYTVKSGDNLTKIARAHGITVSQLRSANNLSTSRVNVGQRLKIPAAVNTNASTAPAQTQPGF